jgi:ethanolamine permease
MALSHITGTQGWMYHLLVTIGLMGLVASFHGIILAAGRATFEFGRISFIPRQFGRVHPRFRTPANALLVNMVLGIVALLTGKTGDIIIMACFGALSLYIMSMITVMVLRKKEPMLPRPFRVPFYPWFPIIALVVAAIALVAMTSLYLTIALLYFAIIALTYTCFRLFYKPAKDAG